jgi:L-lactate permease
MTWVQKINPLHNLALSALIAFIPIAFIFWALIIRKLKSYHSSILTLLLAIVLAVVVSGMPISLVLASALHGALYGLFPICWIILGAVFYTILRLLVVNSRLLRMSCQRLRPTGDCRLYSDAYYELC